MGVYSDKSVNEGVWNNKDLQVEELLRVFGLKKLEDRWKNKDFLEEYTPMPA